MDTESLRARILSLPPLPPEGERSYWQDKQADLRAHILEHDPAAFLTWPSISGTMFVGDCDHVASEYTVLASNGWHYWRPALGEDELGAPPKSKLLLGSSGNLIHQAYHLSRFEAVSGVQARNLENVVEIGGGYGALAKIARRLGFAGPYALFDLPEVLALQEYYLAGTIGTGNVQFRTDPASLPERASLLVALYSLSEMPVNLRLEILDRVRSEHYLIAYQEVYGDVDNDAFFKGLAASRPDLRWETRQAPGFSNCWYLVGAGAAK